MQELLVTAAKRKIHTDCRKYFCNFFITLYEILCSAELLGKNKATFTITREEHIQEALRHNRGVILFAPHIGNFFYAYWYLSQKYDCLTVVTAGSEELRPLYLKFQELGCKGLDYDATPPLQLLRKLKQHLKQNGVVLLFGDFYRPVFPTSTFMGKPMRIPNGTASMALEDQVPIVPFFCYRNRGCHHLVCDKPIHLNLFFRKHQLYEATCRLNLLLEKMIHQVPDQWLYWFNVDERWQDASQELLSRGGGERG